MYIFGPSGTKQNLDAICVLPLNIIHDKIFLILWFWYLILFTVTLFEFLNWLRLCLFEGQRLLNYFILLSDLL